MFVYFLLVHGEKVINEISDKLQHASHFLTRIVA